MNASEISPVMNAQTSDVAVAPAPWMLEGSGYIVAVRMPEEAMQHGSFIPPGLQRSSRSRIALMMFVDYASSDVGPYHELLYIPGKFRFGRQSHYSITRIFVSSWASVINGRRNWGIPKDQCEFDVQSSAHRDQIALRDQQGQCFAELDLEAFGPRLPAPAHWTPEAWRRLSQQHEGKRYTYAPSARGHFRFARVRRWRFDPEVFPDLARGKVLFAMRLTDFRMSFPVSKIEDLNA